MRIQVLEHLTLFSQWWITSNYYCSLLFSVPSTKLEDYLRCVKNCMCLHKNGFPDFSSAMRALPAWSTVAGPGDDRRSLETKRVQAAKVWDLEKVMEIGGSSQLIRNLLTKNPWWWGGWRPLGRFWWFTWICVSNVVWYYVQWKLSHCEAIFSVEVVHVLTVLLSFIFPKADGAEGGQNGGA